MMVVITAKTYAGKISHQKTRDQEARLVFFDRHLLVIDHEAVRKDFVLDVSVLFLRSFRNDVAVLNKQLSPSVVLLDPRIYRHHRNLLREKWEALHVNVIDLSEDVYTQSYD